MQRIHDKLHNGHWIYLFDNDLPILLPCLYCRYTYVTGLSVDSEKKRIEATGVTEFLFEEVEIGTDAQYVRAQQLGLFLEWIDAYNHPLVTLAWHASLPSEYINEYINEYLIVEMQKSEAVVNKAILSLRSYYNWLTYFFDTNYKKIFVFAKYRALARTNNKLNTTVKYLLPATRELIYRQADSLLEEIVLRNGGELGCRTSENQGLYLDNFSADGKIRKGLLSLFSELKQSSEKEEFEYHLPSCNAKYGSARILYISRSHLQLMERYYNTERPESTSNHLLVSNSNNHTKGEVIRKGYGSDTFSKTRKKLLKVVSETPEAYKGHQNLDEANVYHHLRHSFGTDIFHDLCVAAKKNHESITTESRVYIETARRLGHKVGGKYANQTTKIYIHACGERAALLRGLLMCSDELGSHKQSLTSSEIEVLLSEDLKQNKAITSLKQPFSATSLSVPKLQGYTCEYTLIMADSSHPDKVLLYKVMIAAYNYAFFDKEAPINAKICFAMAARPFIDWLNGYLIENRYEILKQYESDRMDALANHGGHSPLMKLMTVLNYAIDSIDFQTEVGTDDYEFIRVLRKTKISPNLNKSQNSLASYFGALDWLRRDDIGIGRELYTALASPKLTISSLSLTAATIILELKKYKSALMTLIQKAPPEFSEWIETDLSFLSSNQKRKCIGNILYYIISAYHQNCNNPIHAKTALNVLLLSNAQNKKAYSLLLDALTSQKKCDAVFLYKEAHKVSKVFCERNITALSDGSLFSWGILRSLSRGEEQVITCVENMMFGWLMASLTVQPYDIPKLTSKSFRKMCVGGRVIQIECKYFKGRARIFHTTRSLSARDVEGQALLTYLDAHPEEVKLYAKSDFRIRNGLRSKVGSVRLLLQCDGLKDSLRSAHSKKDIPFILPSVYYALVKNGVNADNLSGSDGQLPLKDRAKLVRQSESPCQSDLFGLQAIKNSAVHAFSDPYTYHYLINRNSHSNQTEKISYLTEDNEEWMNSAGRITREVMLDLIQNVFDLDFSREQKTEVEAFNSEFMVLSEAISYKGEEMNARLRLVTGQTRGRINEVGVLALSDKNDDKPLSPIYVLDSPLTVLRMHNYLHEFKKHYRKLLTTNPDFLFKTVMPTVEWIESTLNKMSKKSQQIGREQFDEMIKNGVVMSVFHSL